MEYFIVVAILLVIITPILSVLPSSRQRKQMRLRKVAMSLGINIEITSIDDPDPLQEKYLSSSGKQLAAVIPVIAYRLALAKSKARDSFPRVNWAIERDIKREDSSLPSIWCWEGEKPKGLSPKLSEFIISNIESLPEDVIRVDEYSQIVSIYWREAGDEEGLQSIHHFLGNCVKL